MTNITRQPPIVTGTLDIYRLYEPDHVKCDVDFVVGFVQRGQHEAKRLENQGQMILPTVLITNDQISGRGQRAWISEPRTAT